MTVAPDSSLRLHTREQPAQASPLWTRDDAKFLLAAPLLLAAAFFPRSGWHRCARLIEAVDDGLRDKRVPLLRPAVAASLGVTEDELERSVAASRVNRTEHLIHVARSLLNKRWRPTFEITGRHHIDAALAQRRGAVLWAGHFAFASLYTKMALADAGYTISHISRPEHGISKSRLGIGYLNRFRCAAENRHLHRRIVHQRARPDDTKQAALEALQSNQLLSITVGAWEGRHIATGDLLGSRYAVSTGAPGLAFAAGAKLLPVFTTQDCDNFKICVEVGAPLGEAARSCSEAFVHASTQGLLAWHETAIRRAPGQWCGWSKLSE